MSQLSCRPATRAKRGLLLAFVSALAMSFALVAFAPAAKADSEAVNLSFNEGWIKVLSGILPPVEATDPGSDPVTLFAQPDEDGFFTSQPGDFNFPPREIPMDVDDPLISGILGGSHRPVDHPERRVLRAIRCRIG